MTLFKVEQISKFRVLANPLFTWLQETVSKPFCSVHMSTKNVFNTVSKRFQTGLSKSTPEQDSKPISRCDKMPEKGRIWSDLETRALLEIWSDPAGASISRSCAYRSSLQRT